MILCKNIWATVFSRHFIIIVLTAGLAQPAMQASYLIEKFLPTLIGLGTHLIRTRLTVRTQSCKSAQSVESLRSMSTNNTSFSVRKIFYGSNGSQTRRLLAALGKRPPLGRIAAELFRVQKASSRAKRYKGGTRRGGGSLISYRNLAYDRKQVALQKLCNILSDDTHGMPWGWGVDTSQSHNTHVLYVDLPSGQVSFHSPIRLDGETYDSKWDGLRASEARIIEFCQSVLSEVASDGLAALPKA